MTHKQMSRYPCSKCGEEISREDKVINNQTCQECRKAELMSDWQPIETAPMGATFLVWLQEPDRSMGSNIAIMRREKNVTFVNGHFHYDHAPATHWQPLPNELEN